MILLLLVIWVASLLIVPDEGVNDTPRLTTRTVASSEAFSAWVRDSLPMDTADLSDGTLLDALRRLSIAQGSVVARVAPDLTPGLAAMDSLLLAFDAGIAAGGPAAGSRRHVAGALRESWLILAELRQRLPAVSPLATPGEPTAGPAGDSALDGAVAEAGTATAAVDAAGSPDAFRQQVLQAVRALAAGLAAVADAAGAP